MSVIRKFQSGGNNSISSPIGEFLGQKIQDMEFQTGLTGRLRKKGELTKGVVEDTAKKFQELIEAEGENIYNVLEHDPITNDYTINIDKMTNEDLKSKGQEYWSGSENEPTPNLVGKWTLKDVRGEEGSGEGKFMGVVSSWVKEWLEGSPSFGKTDNRIGVDNFTSKTPIKVLGRYINEQYYRGKSMSNVRKLFGEGLDEDQIKGKVKNIAKEALETYIQSAESGDNPNFDYSDLVKAKEFKTALENPELDWQSFKSKAYQLGWTPEQFLPGYEPPPESSDNSSDFYAAEKEQIDPETGEKQKVESTTPEQDEFAQAKLLATTLVGSGFSEASARDYALKGFRTLVGANDIPKEYANVPGLKERIESGKAFLLTNKQKSIYRLVNPDKGNVSYAIDKPGDPSYGSYLMHNQQGDLRYYTPGTEGYNGEMFQDPTKGKDERGMLAKINGRDIEISGIPTKNSSGQTTHLDRLYYEEDGEAKELIKQDDGTYQDLSGNVVNVDLTKYLEPTASNRPYYIQQSVLNNPILPGIETVESVKQIKDNLFMETKNRKGQQELSNKNKNYYSDALNKLKYIATNHNSYAERFKASNEIQRIMTQMDNQGMTFQELITPRKTWITRAENFIQGDDKLDALKKNSPKTGGWFSPPTEEELEKWDKTKAGAKNLVNALKLSPALKEGGVVKLQSGGVNSKQLTEEDYQRLFGLGSSAGEFKSSETSIRDIRGTVKDMSNLDKASLASSAASVLPGIGVVGGLATTGLDIASDLETEGSIDWGNVGLNLGFTALSLFGLGSIGAAGKFGKVAAKTGKIGAKIAKNADDIAKIAKETIPAAKKLEKVEELGHLLSATKKVGKLADDVKFLDKNSLKTLDLLDDEIKALEKSGLISSTKKGSKWVIHEGKATKEISKDGWKLSDDLIKNSKKLIPEIDAAMGHGIHSTRIPSALERQLYKTYDVLGTKVAPKVGKAARIGMQASVLVPAAISVPSAIQAISQDGLGYVQEKDLQRIVLGLAGARGILKNKKLAKNAAKVAGRKEGAAKEYFDVKGEKFDIDPEKAGEIPKLKKNLLINKSKEKNAKTLKEFRKHFEDVTGKKLSENIELSDIKLKETVKTEILDFKKSGLNKKDYEDAVATLTGKITGFGRLNYLKNRSSKPSKWSVYQSSKKAKGGIMKFQNPFGTIPLPKKKTSMPSKGLIYRYNDEASVTRPVGKGDGAVPIPNKGVGFKNKIDPSLKGIGAVREEMVTIPKLDIKLQNDIKGDLKWETEKISERPNIIPIKPKGPNLTTPGPGIKSTYKGIPPGDGNTSYDGKRRPWGDLSTPIANSLLLGTGNRSNAEVAKLMKQAAAAGLYREPMMRRKNVSNATFNRGLYKEQEAKLNRIGRSISDSTANLDQGVQARLAAAEQGSGLVLQGAAADQQMVAQAKKDQLESDTYRNNYNLGVEGRNRQRFGQYAEKVDKIEANKKAMNFHNLQNFITAGHKWYQDRKNANDTIDREEKMFKVLTGNDENYVKAQNEYNRIAGPDNGATYYNSAYQNWKDKHKAASGGDSQKDWMGTGNYRKAKSSLDNAFLNYQKEAQFKNNLYNYSRMFPNLDIEQIRTTSRLKKGGSLSLSAKMALEDKKLSNKVYLSNLSFEQKKYLEQVKAALKSISESNKEIRKGLLKIFK